MLNTICGFLWGVLCTLLTIDIFVSSINILWWIYILLFIIMIIASLVLKVYLYITDYKEMATTGLSLLQKIAKYIKNKRKKNDTEGNNTIS